MVDLNKDVKYIKGVGPNRAKLLNKLELHITPEPMKIGANLKK